MNFVGISETKWFGRQNAYDVNGFLILHSGPETGEKVERNEG